MAIIQKKMAAREAALLDAGTGVYYEDDETLFLRVKRTSDIDYINEHKRVSRELLKAVRRETRRMGREDLNLMMTIPLGAQAEAIMSDKCQKPEIRKIGGGAKFRQERSLST